LYLYTSCLIIIVIKLFKKGRILKEIKRQGKESKAKNYNFINNFILIILKYLYLSLKEL
jgi:hypothetical protein